MKALVIAILVAAAAGHARAAPFVVVVRDGGGDGLAVARLRGQLADLDVGVRIARGAVEPALAQQLSAAARLADEHGARAVVWFVARDGGLAVAVATPDDRRLFVREIPAADPSAVAEAAAVVARGAIRAISEGGTIGVEMPVMSAATAEPAAARARFEVAAGWQVALDGGAGVGAQALAQRTSVVRGSWAAALALSLGPALRDAPAPDVALTLSRSSAALGLERRIGDFAIGAMAGAVLYHRSTISTADGLSATPATITAALVAGAELGWRWRSRGAYGIDATIGVDVVAGAPDLAVARAMAVDSVGQLRAIQPRFTLSVVGLP